MDNKHHVVIVGGGFGGLYAARKLKGEKIKVTLIDRRNFHLFQPLLYQVATGGLSPADIATPLRFIFRHRKNVRVIMGEVKCFNPRSKKVVLLDGEVKYDSLIVAAGSGTHYFGNDHWQSLAPSLKGLEDATDIRSRILRAFEAAERETDPARIQSHLAFVIVGGGPTGVELAGTLAEIARDTLKNDFRSINTAAARIILLEGMDRILQTYPVKLSEKAVKSLERLGVEVRTGSFVTDISKNTVTVKRGENQQKISVSTVIWAAGVKASPLGQALAEVTEAKMDKAGRVIVNPDLSVPGYPDIYVIGDLAGFTHQNGKPLPGVAQVAMQQGRYVARLIKSKLHGKASKPFRYKDRGSMATIGRSAAVADLGWLKFSGFPAWLLWLFVHLMYVVEFQNRLLVLMQWANNYFTRNRSARLITFDQANPQMVSGPFENVPEQKDG